jgi:hypothetical protein
MSAGKQPPPTIDHLIVFLEWLDANGFLDAGCEPRRTHEDVATRYLFERTMKREGIG